MDSVIKFLNNLHIDKNSYVVLACSGGPDSMYLLHVLKEYGYKVVVAHVNHKVRVESDKEYEFLSDYCKNLGVIFEGRELVNYSSGNFENFAREFRYDFFEELLEKYDSKYLFTAHHGDDLIETVLMRLTRGSSLKGYKGFTPVTSKKNYQIIRPLIYLTKENIEYYNNELNIPYVIDNSNLEDEYTRNRYRHHVLPFLKEEDALVHERFIHFSNVIDDVDNYIDRVVNGYLKDIFKNNVLNIENFNKIDEFIQNKIVFNILEILYPDNLYLVNNNHIVEILKVINSDKPNINIKLPGGILVLKEYNKIIFSEEIEDDVNKSYDVIFEDEFNVDNFNFKKVDSSVSNSNYVIKLCSKDIKLPLRFRTRLDGDKMTVKNMSGTKKINDIFIDSKVSKSERERYPLLVDSNNEILWVPGLKKSNFDSPNNDECDIIIVCVKEGERL